MGSSKVIPQSLKAAVARDEPDRDDAASSSSAVLLDNMEAYPEDELPAYSDLPESSYSKPKPAPVPRPNGGVVWYEPPTQLPFSSKDMGCTEVRTHFPDYSNHTDTLLSMIHDQASFAPTYIVQLTGTHSQTTRRNNKDEKNIVTDFSIQINLTHLLQPRPREGGQLEILPDDKPGYRGGILKSLKPTAWGNDPESHPDELRAWCERYVQNQTSVKSFVLKREVINHDRNKLSLLLRSAIGETGYRGNLQISWPMQYKRVVVYSPGHLNRWRTTTWIRWVFYMTFLWVISWPILFLLTRKYEVVKVIYPYASTPTENGSERTYTVMSELEWFDLWEATIKRAALARMQCTDRCLDEDYRLATVRVEARGSEALEQLTTGNAVADGALNLLGETLRVADTWNSRRGWGADT